MSITKTLFVPNQSISKKVFHILVFGQITALILLWAFSPAKFFPKPDEIWGAFNNLWTDDALAIQLFTSIKLSLESIVFSVIISLGFAYANTINFFKPSTAFIGKLRFLSMIGLSFFFQILTDSGHELKVSILVFSMTVFFVTSMIDVINSIPKEDYDLARTLRMNDWQVLYEVVILGQVDKAFDVLRQNAAMGWIMLSFVESLSREEGGIGALLSNKARYLHMPEIFAIQFCILGLGLGQDYLITAAKRFFCPYASLKLERK